MSEEKFERHTWTEDDEKVAFYLSQNENKKFFYELIGEILGMGYNSFNMKVQNYNSIANPNEGLPGGVSERTINFYSKFKEMKQGDLKKEVLQILTEKK